jgi:hypothetical protein
MHVFLFLATDYDAVLNQPAPLVGNPGLSEFLSGASFLNDNASLLIQDRLKIRRFFREQGSGRGEQA